MVELELTRTPDDRRLYALEGVGAVRLPGLFQRTALAEADGRSWRFARTGFWGRRIEAADPAGATVGTFDPRTIRRGGTIDWDTRELTLQPVSVLRERYVLAEGGRDLALLDAKGWGRRPVKITSSGPDVLPHGLLLFAAFIVHQLATDSSAAVGASTAAVG